MLDRAETFAVRQRDIVGGDVVLQIDKSLVVMAVRQGQRPQCQRLYVRLVRCDGKRFFADLKACSARRLGARRDAICQTVFELEVTVAGTGGAFALKAFVRHETAFSGVKT